MTPTESAVAQETQQLDTAKFIEERNAAEQAARQPKLATAKEEPKAAEPKQEAKQEPKVEAKEEKQEGSQRLPRSVRREQNRLREEIGELRGRLAVYEELGSRVGQNLAPAQGAKQDAEPQREEFSSDAEYLRALGRYEARQEAKKTIEETEKVTAEQRVQDTYTRRVQEMDKKALEDQKNFSDWDEAIEKGYEVDFYPNEHPTFMGFLATSDQRSALLYHFAKNPDELKRVLEYSVDPGEQIRQMARLEGRLEKLYTADDTGAAQAQKETASKDRTHPAEAKAGRNASERDAQKPRPSLEVAAKGGSAAPDKPPIGSAAWMRERNEQMKPRY